LQNYSHPVLDEPQLQYFNASVRVAQYMSGGTTPYQRVSSPTTTSGPASANICLEAFISVLLLAFLVNVFILVYLGIVLRVRLITDLCEPLTLFVLGYHSPPDNLFQSLPQDGLNKSDLAKTWIVKREYGQLVVVGQDEATAVEPDEETSSMMRLRPWKTLSRSRSQDSH
jgi:hypothetical protein